MGPVKRIDFSYPRSDLRHPDSEVARLKGECIVWWYGNIRHNPRARSIPLVKVNFRSLKNDVPGKGQFATVPLSSLPHYRVGTVWQEGKCISDTFMVTEKFDVDFSPDGWSLTSRLELLHKGMEHVFAEHEYPLHWGNRDRCKLISFRLPDGKNLLIPCVDYFIRAYARNMEVCRALTTLRWSDVMAEFYEDQAPSAGQWLVRPSRKMRSYDAVFLAHLLYDQYTEMRTREVSSQFLARSPQQRVFLAAAPWFVGQGEVLCRGKWINQNQTFLCLDLVGSSMPAGEDIEWQRLKYDSSEGVEGAGRIVMPRPIRSAQAEELLTEHSSVEPDKHAEIIIAKTPPFKVLGEKRNIKKSKYVVRADRGKRGPNPPTPDSHSSGNGAGSGKNVGKLEHVADTPLESQGFLRDIWNAFKSIAANKQNNVTQLNWYTLTDGFRASEPPKVILLAPIEDAKVGSQIRSWVYLDRSLNQLRGLLVLHIEVAGVDYFCFEIQRKEVDGEKSISGRAGLLMKSHTSSQEDLKEFIEKLCSRIRFTMGVFKNLSSTFPPETVIFNHTQNDEKILYRRRLLGAFRELGVNLE